MAREELLAKLYGTVVIPPAVAAELAEGAVTQPSIHRVLHSQWVTVRTLSSTQRVTDLLSDVDRGEAQAIALYEELHADLLLVDDQEARLLARRLGLSQIGLLGLLAEAKLKGLIQEPLAVVLDELLALGFRASPALTAAILNKVGE